MIDRPHETTDPSDHALLQEATDARGGFALVMRRHSGVLYAVAYRRLGSPADAEEAVQDAFMLLWTKRRRVHFVGDSALPWLIVSVQHLAANRRRSMQRRAGHELTGVDLERSPAAGTEASDGEIDAALARLTPIDADIARLCLVEELTYREAAERLGIAEGSVRNRLSRTRKRLQRDLRGEED